MGLTKRDRKSRDDAWDEMVKRWEYRAEWIDGRKTYPDHCGVDDLLWQPPLRKVAHG